MKVDVHLDPVAVIRVANSLDARLQKQALRMTDRGAFLLRDKIRTDMAAARLGRLGNVIAAGSDLKKTGQVHRRGNGTWSASGSVYIRSRNERTVGTIISYTEGATITPRRGRWLWIATDQVKRLVGSPRNGDRARLEPRLWDRFYGRRFGPLFPMAADDGTPLLVVKNATVSASGKAGSLKPRTKTGRIPKGQVAQEITVVFFGIPNTSRAARLDPLQSAREVVSSLRGQGFDVSAG